MAVITIGSSAISRGGSVNSTYYTIINLNSSANATGILDTASIYLNSGSATACYIGTFYGSSTNWTNRDYALISATIPPFSTQTFTGLDISVVANDRIGVNTTGDCFMAYATSGGSGAYVSPGNYFGTGVHTYSYDSSYSIVSVGGSGATVGKKWNGIEISKWNGVVVSKINSI